MAELRSRAFFLTPLRVIPKFGEQRPTVVAVNASPHGTVLISKMEFCGPMAGRSLELWRRWHARFVSRGNRTARRSRRRVDGSAAGARFESLEAREMLTVTYGGGALLTNVEAQAVYLGSDWSTNSTLQGQAQATDKFLATLVSGPYMDMLTDAGYGVGRGTASAGAVDNVTINKSTALSDNQIQADLTTMLAKPGLQTPDANRLYMVYVEPGVVVQMGSATSQTSFLGYHSAFADGGNVIHYAVLPAPGTPNPTAVSQGFGSNFDELTAVSSHELAEAATDANVNYSTLGWYDYQLNGEIADLTRQTSTISGANGVQYVVQDVVNKNDQVISPSTTQTQPPPTQPPSNPGNSVSAPTLTGSATSTTTAQLTWTAVSGTEGYRVYEVASSQPTLLGTVDASTTSVQVTGLTPGTSVSFEVEAFNSTSAADSNVVSVTTPAPQVTRVSAPHVTAQAASATSVVLSWGAESQATGYNIYWSNGYNVVLLGSLDSKTTSVTITGLQPGSGSYFLVEAFNSVSRADSQWTYVITPFYSLGSEAFFGQFAEQQPSNGAQHPRATHPTAADAHWAWRRF